MTEETVRNFERDGYAVFNEIYDAATLEILKDEMAALIDDFDVDAEETEEFETKNNNRANVFMNSAW